MGGLDPAKLLVILVLALILLGPERLPRAARQIGAFWHDLTRLRARLEQEVRDAVPDLDLPDMSKFRRGGVTSYISGMMNEADGSATAPTSEGSEFFADPAVEATARSTEAGRPAGQAAGIPAGWHSNGALAPGYASGSHLSALPAGLPEGGLVADVSLGLDDPSWN